MHDCAIYTCIDGAIVPVVVRIVRENDVSASVAVAYGDPAISANEVHGRDTEWLDRHAAHAMAAHSVHALRVYARTLRGGSALDRLVLRTT